MKSPMNKLMIGSVLLFLNLAGLAYAGNEGSGGGLAVVCRAPGDESSGGGKIQSAQLLDLYEWPKDYTLQLPKVEATGNAQEDKDLLDHEIELLFNQPALQKLYNTSFKQMLMNNVRNVEKNLEGALKAAEEKQKGTYIFAPIDTGMERPIRLPKGCKLEHVVFYSNPDGEYGNFDANSELWQALSITDRLALLVHESVYSLRRTFFGDKDSAIARRQTATLVALARNTTEQYPEFWYDWQLYGYRSVIVHTHGNAASVYLSMATGKSAKVRIRLLKEDKESVKVIEDETVSVKKGKGLYKIDLKPYWAWTSMEVTLIKSKNYKGESASVAWSVAAPPKYELQGYAFLAGDNGISWKVMHGNITPGYLVRGPKGAW